MNTMKKELKYALLVFFGGCCYGILSTFVKLAYAAHFTTAQITGSQYLIGTILIWIAFIFVKNKEKLSWKRKFKLVLAGTTFGMTGIFYYQSLQTLSASMAIIFLFQFVWIGTLIELLFYKKFPSIGKLLSLIVLITGSLFAANLFTGDVHTISIKGALWGILAAISYSSSMLLSSKMENHLPAIQKSAYLTTGALCMIFLVFPPTFLLHISVVSGVFPYALLLGFFGVCLPPLLYSIGMPHIGPSLGTMLSASELPVAVFMSFFVLHESIHAGQWIGIILILLGIFGGNLFSQNTQKNSTVVSSTSIKIS